MRTTPFCYAAQSHRLGTRQYRHPVALQGKGNLVFVLSWLRRKYLSNRRCERTKPDQFNQVRLQSHSAGPAFDPAAWDSGTTGKRSSIVRGRADYYLLALKGSTLPPFAKSKWSSSLARSTKLTSGWIKFPGNQMITQTTGGMGYDGPELLRLNGTCDFDA